MSYGAQIHGSLNQEVTMKATWILIVLFVAAGAGCSGKSSERNQSAQSGTQTQTGQTQTEQTQPSTQTPPASGQTQTDSARISPPQTSQAIPSETKPSEKGAAGEAQDKGVGPVKQVTLGPIDPQMVKTGQTLYAAHCAGCHAMTGRKAGPPLGNVMKMRTPEFVMNYILDPTTMEQQDPIAKRLRAEYKVAMPAMGLTQDQARAIVEYLRQPGKAVQPTEGKK